MSGFANVAALVDAEMEGRRHFTTFRKVPAVVTAQGTWYDYSMAPGNPSPQYYAAAPLTAQTLARSTDGGIPHGGNVVPMQKYLRVWGGHLGSSNARLMLLDYLLYYPFVDMGTSDEQAMTNVQTLTRYTDGEGVQIMAILVAPHGLLGDQFFVTYTNSRGVAGRLSRLHTMSSAVAVNGTILTTGQSGIARIGPFLALQDGDTGVRSIESVKCSNGTDVGLFTLVLVKPIADLVLPSSNAPGEVDFFLDAGGKVPPVADDAYLNVITCPSGSLSGVALNGYFTFIWN